KRYQYQEVRKILTPATQTPPHFAIGLIFAAMRREWFGLKFESDAKAWEHLKRAAQEEAELQRLPINHKDEAFALAFFGQYIDFWLKRPRPKPLATELKLGPVTLRDEDPKEHTRTAKLDDLSYYPEAGGALCIGEAKTTSGDPSGVIRQYEFHVQPLLYNCLYKRSKRGERKFGKVAGVVLDIACKPYENKKPTFARAFVEIRPEVLTSFAESTAYYVSVAKQIGWDTPVMRAYHCTEMQGRARVDCPYKSMCRFGKAGAGHYVMQDGTSLLKYKPVPGAMCMPWE
ncbi:MAG: PD-(D/E)XK nuclease family protein, partial [Cyanobacteria bacterium REEB65]|nr:PD-(D/E)XK nuclease family protein [Cyanobacteria bacterium REEB65]